jgi:hypothetical protein
MRLDQLLKQDLKDYQCVPFWSWNDKLEEGELIRQISHMKQSGIGGFIMHARGGLQTEYLSDEWMDATKVCIDEANKQNMNAWCYDENGWPSGFAGMKLLKDSANWVHYLTYEIKDHFDDLALAVYKIDNNRIIRLTDADNGVKEYICLYDETNSAFVDILNKEVVRKFIDETHEKYFNRFQDDFGKNMIGFFTDEPQYYRWDTAYTPVLLQEFKKEYGQEILDTLGSLFVDCEQAYEFRFKYWRLMNKLFVEAFAKQIFDWCEEHGCKLTGHGAEESALYAQMWCCAGVMPIYEYLHVPGIDWLGRGIGSELSAKQIGSVAEQLGKKQVMTETFGCTGWDVTPNELKRIAEFQFVNGVNLICQHLYPYSIRGQRKRDYPVFFGEQTPWIKDFKYFNDYFTALSFMLSNSKENVKVAIIHPMHSVYLNYNRKDDYFSVKDLETDFSQLIEKIGMANIGHHYIDELLLEKHGSVNESRLVMGLCEYEYVIIPKMKNLDSSTVNLLKQYISNGGKIWLAGERPEFVDGKKTDIDFLASNTTFEEMQNDDVCISDINTDIRSTYRSADFGDFIYAVNISDEKEYTVDYHVKAKGAVLFDLEERKEKPLYFEMAYNGIRIPLHFKAGQSYVIMIKNQAEAVSAEKRQNTSFSLDTNARIVSTTQNALTIDYACLSYDNVVFEEKMPVMAISDRLLRERKNRTIFLKYCFTVKEIPNTIFVETEKTGAENIWFNGKQIQITKKGTLDNNFVRKDIKQLVKTGLNEIVFEINYYQSEHVKFVLFETGGDRTESLKNCLSYDTDIEAIYILGDFCIYSEDGYRNAIKNTSIANGDFSIVKSQTKIDVAKITQQGYPFFAGDFTFEKEIFVERTDYRLKLKGRFAVAEIFINERFAAKLMFQNECDLSKHLKNGKNILKIRITNSNRNIFGPHHIKDDPEPHIVNPRLFDLFGTWENAKSPRYSDDYSFVNFGVKEIELF